MDLLAIARKIWLYRVATLPVLILTFLGAFYVVVIKSPEYEASSSYVLIQPPPPPTQEDIAIDPSLGRINADNPFTRFTDQSAVVGVLASRLGNESSRDALAEKGADRRYTVAPSSEFSTSSLLVEITGVGSSPEEAVGTAELVGAALVRELDDLQATQNVAQDYRIQAQSVTAPDAAQLSGVQHPAAARRGVGDGRDPVVRGRLGGRGAELPGSELPGWGAELGKRTRAGDLGKRKRAGGQAGPDRGRGGQQDPLQGAVANRTSSTSRRERRRRSRRAGGKNGVPKGKDRQDPIEGGEDTQDPIEGEVANRTSSTPRRERRRRSRRAGGKNGVPKGKDRNGVPKGKDRQDPIEGPTANDEKGNNFSPGHERQGRPRGAGSKA